MSMDREAVFISGNKVEVNEKSGERLNVTGISGNVMKRIAQ
jgi:hypothetical protein